MGQVQMSPTKREGSTSYLKTRGTVIKINGHRKKYESNAHFFSLSWDLHLFEPKHEIKKPKPFVGNI